LQSATDRRSLLPVTPFNMDRGVSIRQAMPWCGFSDPRIRKRGSERRDPPLKNNNPSRVDAKAGVVGTDGLSSKQPVAVQTILLMPPAVK